MTVKIGSPDEIDTKAAAEIKEMLIKAAEVGDEASMRAYYTMLKYTGADEELIRAAVYWAMARAARCGHEAIVRLCHDEWGATYVNGAMYEAATGGHEAIVRLCHDEWGATKVDDAMITAAIRGHEAIVRLCHDEWGVTDITDVNDAMAFAAQGGHEAIVRLCHDWGATNVAEALSQAAKKGHETIVRLCYVWGAADLQRMRANIQPGVCQVCQSPFDGEGIYIVNCCQIPLCQFCAIQTTGFITRCPDCAIDLNPARDVVRVELNVELTQALAKMVET